EIVAKRHGITRQMQDEMAYRSNMRASAAIRDGKFKEEIIPVTTKVYGPGGPKTMTVSDDEGPRPETTMEGLAKLKPAFDQQGTVTAGNSSQTSDGAAAAVLMAAEVAQKKGLQPLAYIRHYAVAGVPPDVMGIGPIPAVRKLMQKSGLKVSDIDLFELNEAFAAQGAYCMRELGLDVEKTNVNGGAIALGHPLGATGCVLVAKLLHEMKRRQARRGVVTMCIGGGMGAAMLFERA
ncbi:MAG: thiolase family protein, partial [Deltaproteobacteria bacterium]|nr:thiolase family protein [Deltaproteobacteria bacterium]